MVIFDNCKNLISQLPAIPLDKNNPEDVDTKAEDHLYDALRYGVMTRPKTPSFSAHTTSTTSANSDVVFDASVTNIGSHYSTSTGRFTAPVAGNYYFSFYGMSPHADSTNIRCYFKINGAAHSSGQMYGGVGYAGGTPTNGYTHISMDTVLPLSANDYVNVYWQNTSMHSEHCKFNGFLIG